MKDIRAHSMAIRTPSALHSAFAGEMGLFPVTWGLVRDRVKFGLLGWRGHSSRRMNQWRPIGRRVRRRNGGHTSREFKVWTGLTPRSITSTRQLARDECLVCGRRHQASAGDTDALMFEPADSCAFL